MRARSASVSTVLALTALLFAEPAFPASSPHEVYGFVAADLSVAPELLGHGVVAAGFRARDLLPRATVFAELNTDTLRLGVEGFCFAPGLCAGLRLEGEALIAGVLTDYFRRGERLPERGFFASYVGARASLRADVARGHAFEYALTGRHWFFGRRKITDPELVLPRDTDVLEQRLGYSFFALKSDASLHDRHRPSLRARGFMGGVELGLDLRDRRGAFGLDARNDPRPWIVLSRQWARAGVELVDGVRVQAGEWAGWGWGEDDLTRARMGGLNPYVVPIAGAPWPAFLASRYLAGEISLHVRVVEDVEVGPLADLAAIGDRLREDSRTFGPVLGLGAFVDARFGVLQVDLKAGYAPALGWQAARPHVEMFALVGSALE